MGLSNQGRPAPRQAKAERPFLLLPPKGKVDKEAVNSGVERKEPETPLNVHLQVRPGAFGGSTIMELETAACRLPLPYHPCRT